MGEVCTTRKRKPTLPAEPDRRRPCRCPQCRGDKRWAPIYLGIACQRTIDAGGRIRLRRWWLSFECWVLSLAGRTDSDSAGTPVASPGTPRVSQRMLAADAELHATRNRSFTHHRVEADGRELVDYLDREGVIGLLEVDPDAHVRDRRGQRVTLDGRGKLVHHPIDLVAGCQRCEGLRPRGELFCRRCRSLAKADMQRGYCLISQSPSGLM